MQQLRTFKEEMTAMMTDLQGKAAVLAAAFAAFGPRQHREYTLLHEPLLGRQVGACCNCSKGNGFGKDGQALRHIDSPVSTVLRDVCCNLGRNRALCGVWRSTLHHLRWCPDNFCTLAAQILKCCATALHHVRGRRVLPLREAAKPDRSSWKLCKPRLVTWCNGW